MVAAVQRANRSVKQAVTKPQPERKSYRFVGGPADGEVIPMPRREIGEAYYYEVRRGAYDAKPTWEVTKYLLRVVDVQECFVALNGVMTRQQWYQEAGIYQ